MRDQLPGADDEQHFSDAGRGPVVPCGRILVARHGAELTVVAAPGLAIVRSKCAVRLTGQFARPHARCSILAFLLEVRFGLLLAMARYEVNAMRTHWFVCLIGVVGAVGCAAVEDVEVGDLTEALEIPTTPCPPFRCNNSPEVIRYGMHELHLRGVANLQDVAFELTTIRGVSRAAIFKNGLAYHLYIDKGRIEGRRGISKLTGQALVGAELHLLRLGEPLYNIKIDRVRDIAMQIGPPETVPVYKFSWYELGGAIGKNICNGARALPENDLDLYERYNMRADETLLFTGDRIDPGALTITPEPTNNWINFGCASFTLAKMFLSRNTSASAWDGINDKDGNQAQLKMYTGDFCGLGDPVTVSGTNMVWQSKKTGYFAPPYHERIEARWNASGATCLNNMRLDWDASPHFPDPWQRVESCNIPACDPPSPYDFGPDGLRVSGIYVP
jgi:ADYC domain